MEFGLPKKIIVLYEGYTEERHVDSRGNILAGSSVTRKGMESLVKEIFEQQLKDKQNEFDTKASAHLISSFVPSNVVFVETSYVSHKFIFKTTTRLQSILYNDRLQGVDSAKYAIPNLIWLCINDDLYLFAYTEWKDLDTKLYKAPFANMSGDRVCLALDLPETKDDLVKYFAEVQDGFWLTNFSHTTTDRVIKGNFANSWKKMKGKKAFDNKLLLPTKKTLRDLCA